MSRCRPPLPEQLTHVRATRIAVAVLGAVAMLLAPREARARKDKPAGDPAVYAAGPMAKFRRDLPPPSGLPTSVSISAARNEFEPFQIVLNGPMTGASATASALTGPGGTIASSNITLYREEYIHVTTRTSSDWESATGWWPDALVPAVDDVYREARNAFPITIPVNDSSNQTRAIWVDVFVPPGTTPGDYSGNVTVTYNDTLNGNALVTVNVPVALHVWTFTLPSTSSLRTAHTLNYGTLQAQHGAAYGTDLISAYVQLALEHRISLSSIDDGDLGDLSGNHFLTTYGPQFLDGAPPSGSARQPPRLAGATLTTVGVMKKSTSSDVAEWWNTFNNAGLGDLLYVNCDEPQTPVNQLGDCLNWFTWSHDASGGRLRNHVTTSIEWWTGAGSDANLVDIFDPVMDWVWPGTSSGNDMPSYSSWLAGSSRRQVWDYQSCDSWGCSASGNTGWPTNAIDANPERNRAEPWISFQLGTKGELYWSDVYDYYGSPLSNGTPWTNQFSNAGQGGNGDGDVFYPGTTSLIGGTHDTPVASIRLKMIRESMEDYEYLLQDAAKMGMNHAMQLAASVFPYAQSTDLRPATPLNQLLMSTRQQLGQEIDGGVANPDFSVSATPATVSTVQGSSTSSTMTVTALNGFSGTVTLSTSGAPSGASATVSPTSIVGSGTSTLTLSSGTAAAGTYTVMVTGTSGSLSHAASVTWTVSSPPSNSGALVWTKQWGTSGNDFGYGLATDAGGDVYLTGGAGGPLTNGYYAGQDAFAARFDANGNRIWGGQLQDAGDSVGRAIAVDSAGNVFVTGTTTDSLWTGYLGGPDDAFLARWDASTTGGEAWSQNIGTSGDDAGYGIAVDASNNVYVVGTTNGAYSGSNSGGYDAFIVKFSNNGSELWRRQLGSSGDEAAYSVAIDSGGNAIVVGATTGDLAGTGNLGLNDFFVAKYDPSGTRVWIVQLGTGGDDVAYGVATDGAGNIYVAGATSGGYGYVPQGGYDAFVDKLDSSGHSLWGGRLLGSSADDFAYRVAVDGGGNVFITGGTLGSEGGLPNAGSYDVFLAKYSGTGSRVWVQEFGGSGDDQATDVKVTSSNLLYLVGRTSAAMPANVSGGGFDVFFSKFQ